MQELKRVLKPHGVLLISCPDKLHYTVEPGRLNPFHVKELFKQEFEDLLSRHFKKTAYYAQRVLYGSGIFASQTSAPLNSYVMSKEIIKESPGLSDPAYWIALASDFALPDLTSSVLEQPVDESDALRQLKNSLSELEQHAAKLDESIRQCNAQNAALSQGVADRDSQIANLTHGVIHRDAQLVSLQQSMAERDSRLSALNQDLNERESRISFTRQHVIERDAQIANLNQLILERDAQLSSFSLRLNDSHSQFAALIQRIIERETQFASLSQQLIDREKQFAGITQRAADYESQVIVLTQRVFEFNEEITAIRRTLSERDTQVASLTQRIAESDEQMSGLKQCVSDRDAQVAALCEVLAAHDAKVADRLSETTQRKQQTAAIEQRDLNESLLRAASFTPLSLNFPNAWVGHLPFAAWLIENMSPSVFVELGTHSGNSFFTFCQAVAQSGVPTRCYAVDTWQGDEHAGQYDEIIFNRVSTYQQQHYREFSRLLRMRFDEALDYFSERSIALLHVDGLHTYEAVRNDFESWLPKLAPGAVVLFHDTNVRERNFGVWKLWEELKEQFPLNLEFLHSHGLGVLQLNDAPENARLPWLEPHSREKQKVVDYFSSLGSRHLDLAEVFELREHVSNLSRISNEKDGHIIYRDGQIASLNHSLIERNSQNTNLTAALADRNSQIAGLAAAVTDRNSKIASLNHNLIERDNRIAALSAAVQECENQLSHLTGTVAVREEQVAQITSSRSWRLTLPIRMIAKSMRMTNGNGGGHGAGVTSPVLHSNGHNGNNERLQQQPYPQQKSESNGTNGRKVQPLFDAEWYLQKNPGVRQAGMNPLEHFLQQGWKEGLNPHPLFDVRYYLNANADVREAGIDPLQHFIDSGWKEGRSPHPLFDAAWYLETNPDVRAAGVNPLLHFLENGWTEGRWPNRGFNLPWYIDTYADVRDSGMNPLIHYAEFGISEGRQVQPSESIHTAESVVTSDLPVESPETEEPFVENSPAAEIMVTSTDTEANSNHQSELRLDITEYLPRGKKTQSLPSGLQVDIVIPVYRGYEETRRCLTSVLADSERPDGVIHVIDDCSPDSKLSQWLSSLAVTGVIELSRNEENLGFVRSVNKGMVKAGRHDVVLLNSDTEVPAGFVRRLAGHAYSKPDIGSVTPFSNTAGEMTGFPDKICRPLPSAYSLTAIDNACQEANALRSVEIPTGVGFCMYIRRDCLDEIGLFDADAFGRGYGEETDFCRRAHAKGWRHLLACDTFVYHIGEVSFGQDVPERAASWNKLTERYPELPKVLGSYLAGKPTVPPVFAATASLFSASPLPTVIIVNHGFEDAKESLTDDLAAHLMGTSNVLALRADGPLLDLTVPSIPGHPSLKFLAGEEVELSKYLLACSVDRVHIQHWIGIEPGLHQLIDALNIPVDLTVHDQISAQ
jgi:GT2 family glycosyltransferase/uncharacterized protein (DUF3084 family)